MHNILLDFLAHPIHGITELRFEPDSGAPIRTGYYNDRARLLAAIDDYANAGGQLSLGVQPRPPTLLARADNRMRTGVDPASHTDIAHFMNVVVTITMTPNDEEQIDSTTVTSDIVDRLAGKVLGWCESDHKCHIVLAVPPITIQNRDDLSAQLVEYGRMMAKQVHQPGATVTAQSQLADHIVLRGGGVIQPVARTELAPLGAMLHRTIPPSVIKLLNQAQGGRLAQLFRGEKSPGVDNLGNELAATPENYDRAFVDYLVAKVKDIPRDDLINALWNRRNSAARAQGIDAVQTVVDAALDTAQEPAAAAPAHRPLGLSKEDWPPETPLRDRLAEDYKIWNDRAGRWIKNIEVDTEVKARKTVQFLVDQGAEFYHFKASQETVFVLDGTQYLVDTRDHAYQSWFTRNVKLFGPNGSEGRELTGAVRVMIQAHENCRKPENSKWGHFDRDNGVLYFCFDPEHADMLRVSAATNGRPRVDTVPNGTDGVTLRGPLGRARKFVYEPDSLREGFGLFKKHIYEGQALSEIDRLMSIAFNMTTLIPDSRQRPIKFHRGSSGSGKTYAGYDWEVVIYGRQYSSDYNDRPSLLQAIKLAGPFVTQDNAEAAIRRKFHQVYLVASTGSDSTLRKFYTESDQRKYEPNGTLCLSAIEPMAKTEEIRRSFEFNFDEYYHQEDPDRLSPTPRMLMLESIADKMLSAVFDAFSLYILPNWQDRYNACVRYVQNGCPRTLKRAFDDWLGWMLLVAESIGPYLWNEARGDRPFDARAIFHAYLDGVAQAERTASMEGDMCLSCLESLKYEAVDKIALIHDYDKQPTYVNLYGVRITRDPTGVITLGPVTTSMLFKAFSAVGRNMGVKLPYEHGRVLGSRLTVLCADPAFEAMGWRRNRLAGKAHGNQLKYTYVWEPPERIVPTPTIAAHEAEEFLWSPDHELE